MTPQARRIPDTLLERYLTDALDAQTKALLEATLAESPEDRARLEELRADSAAFLIQHPPGPLVERFRQERKRARWSGSSSRAPSLTSARPSPSCAATGARTSPTWPS